MKDVRFPIDAVFLNQGRVWLVLSELPPCTREPCPVYGGSQAVDQVLEIKGGQATKLGITPGKYLAIQSID
ncbi:MAG: DUF192 domain-containing protein [Cyanobacteria bacterium P01_D01_bin.56]